MWLVINSTCVFLALGVIFTLLCSKGNERDYFVGLSICSYFCAFLFSVASCVMPLLSLMCCLSARHHICPLCNKYIGVGSCEGGVGCRIRTPDYLADMA